MSISELEYMKSHYEDYSELIEKYEDAILSRVEQIGQEMLDFIRIYDMEAVVFVHEISLAHAVFDYFSDIDRLKKYQDIKYANSSKIKAYETAWLLKRHPLQLKQSVNDDKYAFVNERFVLMRLTSYMMGEKINMPIIDENRLAFDNFLDVLFYYFKYRDCDPKTIELMLLSFEAGRIFI